MRYCRATGVKDVTIYSYLPRLHNFLIYLHKQSIDNICDIDEYLIQDFTRWLEEKEIVRKTFSVKEYIKVVKKFMKFLIERKISPEDMERVYKHVKL
ncbi:MAG: site-specific integrase, partial [Crenarchaeota archaeon]|nr:site-specific integrase [Thermoproteota archaeon]